jgi:hypothetical protein
MTRFLTMIRPLCSTQVRTFTLGVLFASATGCSEQDAAAGDDAGCEGAKCDAAGDGLVGDLEGLDDPIARWLRENVSEDDTIEVSYLDMLRGISEMQGCTESQIDSYSISDDLVTEEEAFPRIVNTVCSTDRMKADLAFFALSFPLEDDSDIDTRTIEMFGWDATQKRYVFYKTVPASRSSDAVVVEVEPVDCQECHLQPTGVDGTQMPMTPIMNELQAPWQHWHSEPNPFDHHVPDAIQGAPSYSELAAPGSKFLRSASRLESSIRSAFNGRIASARVGVRSQKPASVDASMAALRPLFCDEQLTYVTEDGASGLLPAAAVIDDGWHSVFSRIMGTGWPWAWWNDRTLRLSPPGAPDMLKMLPVRGASVVVYEKLLLQLRGITAEQLATIRALDWHTPVMSKLRCDVFGSALARVSKVPPIELTADTTNATLMRALVDEILVLHPADLGLPSDLPEAIPLVASDPTRIVALSEAGQFEAMARALAEGTAAEQTCGPVGEGFCEVTLQEMGDLLEARYQAVQEAGRAPLEALRLSRACEAEARFSNAPALGEVGCQ